MNYSVARSLRSSGFFFLVAVAGVGCTVKGLQTSIHDGGADAGGRDGGKDVRGSDAAAGRSAGNSGAAGGPGGAGGQSISLPGGAGSIAASSSQAGSTTTGGTAGTSSSSRYDAGAFDAYRPDTRDAAGGTGGTKFDAPDAYRPDTKDAWVGGSGGSSSSGGAGSSGSRDAWVPDAPLPDAYVPDAPVDTPTGGTGGASSSSSSGGSGGATSLAVPKIDSFNVSNGSVQGTEITVSAGKSVTFLWSVSGAITKSIDQGVGDVTGASKTITVPSPSTETTYTYKLIITNSTSDAGATFDKAEATVKVIVVPLSITSFTADPAFINSGSSSTLTAVYAGSGATIDQGVGAVTSSVGVSVSPTEATKYSVTVTNRLGDTIKADVTVNVLGLDAGVDTSP